MHEPAVKQPNASGRDDLQVVACMMNIHSLKSQLETASQHENAVLN